MTDLISKLADDILAMINAQPRSPTKEELEELIRDRTLRWDPINNVLRSSADADINVHRPTICAFDCQGEWVITQEDLVKAADEVCEREAVRQSPVYKAYEEKATQPCPIVFWDMGVGEHDYRPTGFDSRGLFCQVGDKRDVSGGTHLHCTCGASKFTA